jgi:hypothetical protein
MAGFTPEAVHLKLSQRKALAARLAFAQHLDFSELPACDQDALNEFTKFSRLIIDRANDIDEATVQNGRLDSFLSDIAESLNKFAITVVGPAGDELRRRKQDLHDRLAAIDCEHCAGGPGVCSGEPDHDDPLVAKTGLCLKPIQKMVDLLKTEVTGLYEKAAPASIKVPHFVFNTFSMPGGPGAGLLESFHVAGESKVRDCEIPVSIVGLSLKRQAFDWPTFCQVPYVLMHEFLCHAFQGLLASPDASAPTKREGADETCPWTEGWMDRFAAYLAKRWIGQARGSEWFRFREDRARGHIEDIHKGRYEESPSLKGLPLLRRRAAARTFDALQRGFAGHGRQSVATSAMLRFSLRLNLFDAPQQQGRLSWRERALALIETKLSVPGSRTYDDTIGTCRAFAEHGDPIRFVKELEKVK